MCLNFLSEFLCSIILLLHRMFPSALYLLHCHSLPFCLAILPASAPDICFDSVNVSAILIFCTSYMFQGFQIIAWLSAPWYLSSYLRDQKRVLPRCPAAQLPSYPAALLPSGTFQVLVRNCLCHQVTCSSSS